ncbi:DNA recombination protein RmuC [Campylobacter sp. RM9333]|uniref:DNA recombination protein RmuC n=1 Tax=Campylobacter sp. RM9333 TaxID=2735731 RepID=UPI001D33996F|nr:DNA recombination protein RmuC [Campylobacter sp. RM9333]
MTNELILAIISIVFFIVCIIFYIRYINIFKSESSLKNEFLSLAKDKEYLSVLSENLKQELNSYKNNLVQIENERNNLNIQNSALSEKINNLENDYKELKNENNFINAEIANKRNQNEILNTELSRLNEELKNTKEQFEKECENLKNTKDILDNLSSKYHLENAKNEALNEKVKLYENNLKSLEEKYENTLKTLENNLKEQNEKSSKLIYEENTKVLLNNSNELLNKIFSPLKEQISEYEKALLKQNTSIENNIKTMFETSQNLGKKADEFANILKGDKKARGDFGEIMLKQCLLSSGLIENEHFFMQESFKDSDNNTKRPDAIVYFEPNKCVIIDSKFSLPSSDNLEVYKDEIANNLNARINELAKKDYELAVDFANEYVILFVPYQNILDLALESDSQIFKKAEAKKIFLVSPTTLFMGLKMIYFGWKNYEVNQNALKVFNEFGKFYDKYASFYEDYEKLKKQCENGFLKIDTHLYGKGSISSRLENLKALGIKNKKELSELAKDLKDSEITRLIDEK